MVAQLLGLDRPGSRRYKVLDRHEYLDADAMYEYVVRVERVLSLLLGLPTSTNGLNLGQSLHDEVVPAAQDQMTIGMSGIIVKVLARNQLGATPQNLEMTRTIDLEDEIAKERNRPEAAAGVKSRSILVIKVPYIGHVTISHKGVVMMTPAVAEQLEESDEDVTIGGLGSIRASYPNTPGHEERESDCDAQISATSQPMCCAAPRNLSSGVETGQHNLAMQKETMFPDAAAGLDDWTFQGLDTAFFDSLMRGSNDPLPDASLQQSIWDTRTTWPGRHMDSTSALPDT
ncbi:hypothetical protein B0A48_09040 [Cryoendolithus antarcticus]|uniref:Uncharacterized protein n=1 Tax=Cryoendolithus antarcticus TaxID=1507870 RepID=A0A1V8T1H1_9PEZI|nr:hypothetical protein B0A48_09040 [Cryoendolithus antarcticus]